MESVYFRVLIVSLLDWGRSLTIGPGGPDSRLESQA